MTTDHGANWSNTDFPYMCLRDLRRTEVLLSAVRRSVSPGDVVVEVGGGSGILTFAAAKAGASEVIVVELDPLLAECLRRGAEANGLGDVVRVVEGDAMEVPLPPADLVISEMIETGLLDELQVPVINRLHRVGVIHASTKLIPCAYTTELQLARASFDYFGFTVLAPKHLWPFYEESDSWVGTAVTPVSEVAVLVADDFRAPVPTGVDRTLTFDAVDAVGANAVRLSGVIEVLPGEYLRATNALNGDKVVALPAEILPTAEGTVTVDVSLQRGGGLGSLVVSPSSTR